MKCLLCNFNSNEPNEVRGHYITFDKVDPKTEFFKKIFPEVRSTFHGKRCVKCQEFLPTSKFKITHDFLKHYENGKNVIQQKSVNILNIGTVREFEITFQELSSSYDFYNSEALIDEFLLNVKNRIERSNADFFVRCGLSLENIQAGLSDDDQALKKFTVLVYRSHSNKII